MFKRCLTVLILGVSLQTSVWAAGGPSVSSTAVGLGTPPASEVANSENGEEPAAWRVFVAGFCRGTEAASGVLSTVAGCGQATYSLLATCYNRAQQKDLAVVLRGGPFSLEHLPKEMTVALDTLKDAHGLGADSLGLASSLAGAGAVAVAGGPTHFGGSRMERTLTTLGMAGGLASHIYSGLARVAQGADAVRKNALKNRCGSASLAMGLLLAAWQLQGQKWWYGRHPDGTTMRRRIRAYNTATQIEAVRRHVGWLAWALAVASNVCSYLADDAEDQYSDAKQLGFALGRDIPGVVAAALQATVALEAPVKQILEWDEHLLGIYEDPGSKLVRCLPEASGLRGWLTSLQEAYWQDGESKIQAEFLSLPGRPFAIVGLELRDPEKPDSRICLLFGKIDVGVGQVANRWRFTPQPLKGGLTLFGVVGMPWNTDLPAAQQALTLSTGAVEDGPRRLHQQVNRSLGLADQDGFVHNIDFYEQVDVAVESERVMYRAPQTGAVRDRRVDMLVVFATEVEDLAAAAGPCAACGRE
ncbi:MAG: hypothetical protein OXT67_11810 [Zetaproteobacteria bacterium]|nr:hypothetical protein [Zetaproteobacteria bacterium]